MDTSNTGGAPVKEAVKSPAETVAETLRAGLLTMEAQLTEAKALQAGTPNATGEDRGEVLANLTLAYRHIEDARMRLGKVFQALNGGVSNNTR